MNLLIAVMFFSAGLGVGLLISYSRKDITKTAPTAPVEQSAPQVSPQPLPKTMDVCDVCDLYFDMCINQHLSAKYKEMLSWTYEKASKDRMGYKYHTVKIFMKDGSIFHENVFNNEVFAGWPHRLTDEDRYRTKDLQKQRKAVIVEIIAIAEKKREKNLPSFSYPLDSFARDQLEQIQKELLEEGYESQMSKNGRSLNVILPLAE